MIENICKICGQYHTTGLCTEQEEIGFEDPRSFRDTQPSNDDEYNELDLILTPEQKKEKAILLIEHEGFTIEEKNGVYIIETDKPRYVREFGKVSLQGKDGNPIYFSGIDIANLLMKESETLLFRGNKNNNLECILETGVDSILGKKVGDDMQNIVIHNKDYPIWVTPFFEQALEYSYGIGVVGERILDDGSVCVYDISSFERFFKSGKTKDEMFRHIFAKSPKEALLAVIYFHNPDNIET